MKEFFMNLFGGKDNNDNDTIQSIKIEPISENDPHYRGNKNEVETETMDLDSILDGNNIAKAYLNFNYEYSKDMASQVQKYSEYIDYSSRKWGVPDNLLGAMMAQESSGNQTNLMQIEFDVNKDDVIKVYNFIDNRYEKVVLTDNPSKYNDCICITRKDLENPKTNISVAAILLAKTAREMDYNIPLTIQAYNYGSTRTKKVINDYTTVEEALANKSDLEFVNHTDKFAYYINDKGERKSAGDPNYLRNVLRYLTVYEEDRQNNVMTFKQYSDGEIKESSIEIIPSNQM
ncbi:MAG: lysozyme family protein [Bacilli bacterium]|nr:lysozyme family protein [Bacilli bacterium]